MGNLVDEGSGFVSGFIATIGRANVGKSTLINRMVGQKVLIVSEKPQTTRNKITCILTNEDCQCIFLDTPGMHKPRHRLGERMVRAARESLNEVDIVLYLVDGTAPVGRGDRLIADELKGLKTPVLLAVNKIDLVSVGEVEKVCREYGALGEFEGVFPVSALHGDGLADLLSAIKSLLPPGPKYYPDDMVTDRPERFIIRELIREKVLHLTREEVPHSVAVDVEEMEPRENNLVYVRASLYVEKESQKGILIGRQGRMLKEIGRLARGEIEGLLGSKIYLDLWVKVKEDWRNREGSLQNLGYGEL